MWQGDFVPKPELNVREKLLAQREELVKQINVLKKTPLPRGDTQQMQRFRTLDLQELAAKVLKIDKKLGRGGSVQQMRI